VSKSLDIAKDALIKILENKECGTAAQVIALQALTEIAIEEQVPPHRPIAPSIIKRMFHVKHGGD